MCPFASALLSFILIQQVSLVSVITELIIYIICKEVTCFTPQLITSRTTWFMVYEY